MNSDGDRTGAETRTNGDEGKLINLTWERGRDREQERGWGGNRNGDKAGTESGTRVEIC